MCKTFLLSTVYTNSSFNWHQHIFRTGTFQLHIHYHMTITAVSRLCSKLFYCLNHKVKMVKEIVDTNTYHSSFCCFKMYIEMIALHRYCSLDTSTFRFGIHTKCFVCNLGIIFRRQWNRKIPVNTVNLDNKSVFFFNTKSELT